MAFCKSKVCYPGVHDIYFLLLHSGNFIALFATLYWNTYLYEFALYLFVQVIKCHGVTVKFNVFCNFLLGVGIPLIGILWSNTDYFKHISYWKYRICNSITLYSCILRRGVYLPAFTNIMIQKCVISDSWLTTFDHRYLLCSRHTVSKSKINYICV